METKKDYKKVTKRENGSTRVQMYFVEPSKTDQSFAEDVDVNNIMKRYQKTGILPNARGQGVYADLSEIPDLLTASTIVEQSQRTFDQLPAEARFKFQNNPQEMINFLQDPKNHEEAVKLGLLTKREEKSSALKNELNEKIAEETPPSKNKKD